MRFAGSGTSIPVTSSPGCRVVTPDFTKKSSMGMRRSPGGLAASTTAP